MTGIVVFKTAETATTVTLEWLPVAGAHGYVFLYGNGRSSSTLDGSRTSLKIAKTNLPVEVRAGRTLASGMYPPPPAAQVHVTGRFEIVLKPRQTSEGAYTGGWLTCTSPFTAADDASLHYHRTIVFDHHPVLWVVWGRQFQGDIARGDNFHCTTLDGPTGSDHWENNYNGVSPLAFSFRAGKPYDVQLEAEDSSLAHTVTPRSLIDPAVMRWYAARIVWGRKDLPRKGELQVWDIGQGKKVVDLASVNTHYPGQRILWLWQGGYNSSGVSSDQAGWFTPAGLGDTFEAALADRPVELSLWGTSGPGGVVIPRKVGTVERPDALLRQVVAGWGEDDEFAEADEPVVEVTEA